MLQRCPTPDSYWLLEGRLLAGSYAGAWTRQATKEKLDLFLQAGIRSFIDLTDDADPLMPYADVLKELADEQVMDLRYQRLAIPDRAVPTIELMTEILTAIRAELNEDRPVYFHCAGGIGRTGTVAACWLIESGMAADEALALVTALRWQKPSEWLRSPETEEQCEFVRSWKPPRSAPPSAG